MATEYEPRIGDWYRNPGEETFEIVAFDEADETVEIQYFDGTVEELDLDTWYELDIEPTARPWRSSPRSGSPPAKSVSPDRSGPNIPPVPVADRPASSSMMRGEETRETTGHQ